MYDEHEARLQALRDKFDEWKIDGVLIGSETNRRWLSGFTGSFGQLLVTRDQAILATDFRYWEQATAQAPAFTLFKHRRTEEDTAAFIASAAVERIGLEANHMTLLERAGLQKVAGVTWVHLVETVESLRWVKSSAEIEKIRTAAALTDQTMAQVPRLARPGISERGLAWELEKFMRESGAEATAFTLIVASGPNSARPHHRPGERLLQVGDVIIVDMGAQSSGYKSDLTRTFYLGNEPTELFWEVYNLVLAAQTAAINNLRPGLTGKEADALARNVIVAAGHEDHFGHGLGHGVGLDIHEGPQMSVRAEKTILEAGMVTTIEPGVYIPGWGGVRLEDLTQLTETGVELLSHSPKTPIINCE